VKRAADGAAIVDLTKDEGIMRRDPPKK